MSSIAIINKTNLIDHLLNNYAELINDAREIKSYGGLRKIKIDELYKNQFMSSHCNSLEEKLSNGPSKSTFDTIAFELVRAFVLTSGYVFTCEDFKKRMPVFPTFDTINSEWEVEPSNSVDDYLADMRLLRIHIRRYISCQDTEQTGMKIGKSLKSYASNIIDMLEVLLINSNAIIPDSKN